MQKRIGVFLLTVLLLVMLLVGSTTIAHAEAGLSIIAQPQSTTVYCGETAEVFVSAVGDDLQYKWYYKNKGGSKFALTNTFTSDTYSVEMDDSRDGRMIYCVVTDKYGNSLQTDIVTLAMSHSYDEGVLTKEATCNATGARVYTCQRCRVVHTEVINTTEHNMSQWTVYKEATATDSGVERTTCKDCGYYEERSTAKLDAAFYITVNTDKNESYKVAVDASGKYKLDAPEKKGYVFSGWVDKNENTFEPSGVITADTEVVAQWTLDGTDTIYELVDRAESGVDKIFITSDIVVDRPIYFTHKTTVYSDGDYSIIRAADYAGDVFVVGSDKNGTNAINLNRKAVLTVGGGKGTLTLDGNRDKVTVDVVGSMIYAADSSVLNIYDGVRIANNKKVGNERVFGCLDYLSYSTLERAGGAGVLSQGATVNMYGGVIENNLINTVHTVVENEDGTTTSLEINGCGAGLYSYGNFYMYGGTIRNNEGLRGGGLYVARVSYIKAGTISDNIAHYYGGAFSTSSAMQSNTYLGTEGEGNNKLIISGNHSYRAGGAMYSNTSSPIIIYGNTEIINNTSDTSGGAIYTAGPVTARNAVFKGNSCLYSGGAIYHHYTKAEFTPRLINLKNCVFEENKASLGGAVILSASDTVKETGKGTQATIIGCNFVNNHAYKNEHNAGNGGAIYITRSSKADISDCYFTGNNADTNAGAVAIHSSSTVTLTDCDFDKNTALYGGAVYTSSKAKVDFKNITFSENKTERSGGNGGALYINEADVTWDNVDFYNNSAANNGGACYLGVTDLDIDASCNFEGNLAGGHGGAFYLTYKTLEDGTRDGAVLNANGVEFKNNTALAGGAVSIRTDCKANLKNVKLTGNSATSTGESSYGGGAVYVGYGKLTLSDVTATDNTSAFFGGVIDAVGSEVTIKNCEFAGNTAITGGAVRASSSSTVNVEDTVFTNNMSLYENKEFDGNIGGGAISTSGGVLNIFASTFDGNGSGYYGGTILSSSTTVVINNNTVIKNSVGKTGSALHFRGSFNANLKDVSVIDNIDGSNGVIYANGGTLSMTNVVATGNSAKSGGVLYVSGTSTNVTLLNSTWSNNTASTGGAVYVSGATVVLNNAVLTENTANKGGAIYNENGSLVLINADINNNHAVKTASGSSGHGGAIAFSGGSMSAPTGITFRNNTAEGHGGALYLSNTDLTTYGNYEFIENTAGNHGGAIYLTYINNEDGTKDGSVLNAYGTKFENNTAMGGGAISIRTACEANLTDVIFIGNSAVGFDAGSDGNGKDDGDGEGGGAIYVGYGTLNLTDTTFTANTSTGFGGAVDSVGSTVNITNGQFDNNEALYAGAIYAMSNSSVTVNGTNFTANKSTYDNTDYDSNKGGGAISIKGGNLTVSGATFDGNSSDYYGGTILANGTTVVINGDTVVKNSIGSTGSALNFKGSCKVTLEDISVLDNKGAYNGVIYANGGTFDMKNVTATGNSATNGGVLYISGASTNATITNCTFSNNNATKGGVISLTNGTLIITDSTFTENTASTGGAVYNEKGTLTVTNTIFTSNSASKNGGAIALAGGTLSVTGDNDFTSNTAGNGGAIYATYFEAEDEAKTKTFATVNITDAEFSGNTANYGGAIYVYTGCVADIENSTFKENSSVKNGGAVYVYNAELNVNGGNTFSKNTSSAHGGAICLSGSTMTAEGINTFTENTATSHGGAIYVTYTENADKTRNFATLTMTDGTFTANSAMGGGAVSIRTGCEASFNGTLFENNKAEGFDKTGDEGDGEGGGAIYVGYGTLNLTDVTLNGNTSTGFGAAVDAVSATVNITGGEFSGNEAPNSGAIYAMTKSNVTVNGTTFTSNKSTYANTENDGGIGGGAININKGSLTISNATFDSNGSGYYGGTILANGATIVIDGNTVIKNSVGKTGSALHFRGAFNATLEDVSVLDNKNANNGVIYANGGTLNMTNVTASGNSANSGAVIYASGKSTAVTINNSVFNNNSATNGTIYAKEATLTITDTEFTSNTASNGGAVCGSNANVTVNNSTFTENTASSGGAVYVNDGSVLVINGSEFIKNSAILGGAVNSRESTAEINNSIFTANSAKKNSSGSNGNGGAIVVTAGTLTASGNNTFTGNTAENHGGAIYVSYSENEDKTKNLGILTMTGGYFEGNTAVAGGAISSRTECQVTLTGTEIKGNSASGKDSYEGGGAIYSNNNTLILSGVILDGNSSAYYGGAVNAPGANVTIKDNSQIKNNIGVTGVALYFRDGGTYTLTDVSVTDNIASSNGSGVIYLTSSSEGNFTNLTASGNKNNNGGVIYTSGSANVTLTDSNLSNNTALNVGGAIDHRSSGKFEVINTTFTGNTAKNGGAIYTNKSIAIDGCEFTSNTASEYGGAIVVAGGNLTATGDNTFTANSAAKHAGAVYVTTYTDDKGVTSASSASFTGGTFTDNTASNGGAMYINKDCVVTLDGTDFTENKASSGGAIYIDENGKLTISNTNFTSNSATGNGGAISVSKAEFTLNNGNTFTNNTCAANGGAIWLSKAIMTATGENLFTDNSAKSHGGAIYLTYVTIDDVKYGAVLNVDGAEFKNNTAMGGGAISIRTNCEANLTNSIFTGNSVEGFDGDDEKNNDGNGEGGGAIYVGYGTLNLTDSTFTANTSTGFGGAIDSVESTVNIMNGEFKDNEALYGGAIYAMSNSSVTVNGTNFTANKSTYDNTDYDSNKGGGAISIKGGKLTVSGATFDGNSSDYYGGTILANGTTVVINGNSVFKNSVGETGSALNFKGSCKVTLEDISVLDNKGAYNGVIYANGGTFDMKNVTATGNSATNGGVLYISGASTNATITNCTFSNNNATKGGVIWFTSGNVDINNSTFTSNTAETGGAVYNEKGTLTLTDSTFTSNTATKNGGAIVLAGGTLNTAGKNVFTLNTTSGHAGAVYVTYFEANDDAKTKTYSTANITGADFVQNSAKYGGAVSVSSGCVAAIENSTFNENSSSNNGGAVYVNSAEITMSSNTFSKNTSSAHGGAICLSGGKITATGNNTFTENTAVKHGGAIYVTYVTDSNGYLEMTGGTFTANSALGGGAVSVRSNCEANFNGTVFENNSVEGFDPGSDGKGKDDGDGEGGGAIYVGYGALNLTDSIFTGNTSTGFGGAVDVVGSTATVTGGKFEDNEALYGGAINALSTAKITVSDKTQFNSNSATSGGAMYIDKASVVTISDASFEKNTATDGDGGAILIADTSTKGTNKTTLNMSGVAFKGNTASSKGGAISTDTASPNLVINAANCTFTENKALGAGGGAVEIQNGNCNSATDPTVLNIVFTNCTFTGNTAKTTGGAVEIRTNSCAKFDGITATNNACASSNNGGVFYVTSNYSRLYITGEVVASNNTAKNGTFAYLYNSSYTNPPRIYTTHSNTASWVSQLGGNKTSVTYNLTEMP